MSAVAATLARVRLPCTLAFSCSRAAFLNTSCKLLALSHDICVTACNLHSCRKQTYSVVHSKCVLDL